MKLVTTSLLPTGSTCSTVLMLVDPPREMSFSVGVAVSVDAPNLFISNVA
ncbi:MAG TPA: hypothetical protein PKV16_04750 [Caldisericia bacterium]|nr:hypothetical protein [Caldisericia bacterium]HPF48620.1 hypothetical protein [Caldisericia bacterium]HPI83720.1 hypothetical protein [Caldisericia bacterium]HPQ93075.1 hypothetical protein [Caldisericia bacterium]HRV75092.1 hypothetical protein [Caldisericia bacterium]